MLANLLSQTADNYRPVNHRRYFKIMGFTRGTKRSHECFKMLPTSCSARDFNASFIHNQMEKQNPPLTLHPTAIPFPIHPPPYIDIQLHIWNL